MRSASSSRAVHRHAMRGDEIRLPGISEECFMPAIHSSVPRRLAHDTVLAALNSRNVHTGTRCGREP